MTTRPLFARALLALAALFSAAISPGLRPARAADPPPMMAPAGGVVIAKLTADSMHPEASAAGTADMQATAGPGFDHAVRVVVSKRGNPWDVQFHVPIPAALAKGDVLLVHFWARTVSTRAESGVGTLDVTVQRNAPDWTASIDRSINVPTEWKEFFFRGASKDDYPAGTMTLDFRCGTVEQTLDIGGIELLSYGKQVALTDLPSLRSTYAGREANAPWRAEAEARIQQLRTTPFVVQVRDQRNKPIIGATVKVHMTRNAFGFGAAVPAIRLTGETPDDRIYQTILLQNFNSGSFVNDLKWPAWIGEWGADAGKDDTLSALKWVKNQGLDWRGHVLVWPSWRNLPAAMAKFKDKPDKTGALAAVHDHIVDEVTATRGYLTEWDVVNEPFDNHDLMDAYGKDIMVGWYKTARQANPTARLTLNDYSILTSQTDTEHEQFYEDTLRYLLAQGAPIDVMGMQGHFGDTPPTPTRVYELLNRYAKLGPKIRVTEFTVDTDDEQLRADWTRDLLTILYSHPDVIGWQCWTFDDLFDIKTGHPKPAGLAFQELALHRWRTEIKDSTNRSGDLSGRGYLGSYVVSATYKQNTVAMPLTLSAGATGTVTITMP